MGVTADDDVDRGVEFFGDLDDGAGNAGTFIIVPGRKTAFVDQDHDRLDAARFQFGNGRIDGFRLVFEFEPGSAGRRDDVGCALQGQADEADGDAVELADLVRRKDRLAGILLEGRSRKVMEFRTWKRVWPLTTINGMTAAILHSLQFVLAL